MVGFTGSAEDKLSWKKQTKQIDLHIIWVATEIVLNVNQWNIAWSRCLKEKRPDFYIKRFLTSPHFIWCFILSLWTRDWLCANSAQYRTSQLRFGRRWWRAEEQRSLWLWVCWCLCVPTRALPMSIRLLWCRRAHLAFCSSRRCKPGAEQELQAVLWGKKGGNNRTVLCPVPCSACQGTTLYEQKASLCACKSIEACSQIQYCFETSTCLECVLSVANVGLQWGSVLSLAV